MIVIVFHNMEGIKVQIMNHWNVFTIFLSFNHIGLLVTLSTDTVFMSEEIDSVEIEIQ